MRRSGADANSLADRKEAERRRLAEALRANLGRRKARSRHRQATDAAAGGGQDVAGRDDAGDAGAAGDIARTDAPREGLAQNEGSAQDVETGD
jgi:hypothetical protein